MNQSLSLAVAATVSSSLVVSRAFPQLNHDFVNMHVNQTSPLALTLDTSDIHMHSAAYNLGVLDFDVAATIWAMIKCISRTIILAANPGMSHANIKPFIPAARLTEIEMPVPVIIQAYAFTQNPCHLISTPEDIISRFQSIQSVGIEGLRWLMHARARCSIYDNAWVWSTMPTETFAAHPALAAGPIPTSTDRLLDLFTTENTEHSLILHPTMSNDACAARASANIPLPEEEFYDLQYPMSEDEADEEYNPGSPIFSPSDTPFHSPVSSLLEEEHNTYSNYSTYGGNSSYNGGTFSRSMSPLDIGVPGGLGTNYVFGDTREIIDLTYDSDGDSVMTDE